MLRSMIETTKVRINEEEDTVFHVTAGDTKVAQLLQANQKFERFAAAIFPHHFVLAEVLYQEEARTLVSQDSNTLTEATKSNTKVATAYSQHCAEEGTPLKIIMHMLQGTNEASNFAFDVFSAAEELLDSNKN